MAQDFDEPTTTSSYSSFATSIRDNLLGALTWFAVITGLHIPDKSKRYDPTNRDFREYDAAGASWDPLLDIDATTTPYEIRVSKANNADYATAAGTAAACTGTVATADLATNATNLNSKPSSSYTQNANNLSEFTATASTARNNIGVYSTSETDNVAALRLLKTQNLNDLSNKGTARTNLSVYSTAETNSKIASEIGTALYATTTSAIAPAGTSINAPVGYRFIHSTNDFGISLTAINASGTVVTFTSIYTTSVSTTIFWVKLGS